jgi:hypothetical protein
MERELKAFVQSGLADLTSGRAGPATQGGRAERTTDGMNVTAHR